MHPLPRFADDDRPTTAVYDGADELSRAHGDHLRMIHDMYRDGLARAAGTISRVAEGTAGLGDARAAINEVGLRQAYEHLGSFCGQLCRGLAVHHHIEDTHLYPVLRAADGRLDDVLDRLGEEHRVVHEMLQRLDDTLLGLVDDDEAHDPSRLDALEREFAHLRGLLESHFVYEEEQLGAALGVHRIHI